MYGYATDETPECMPLTIMLAHQMNRFVNNHCVFFQCLPYQFLSFLKCWGGAISCLFPVKLLWPYCSATLSAVDFLIELVAQCTQLPLLCFPHTYTHMFQ